MNILVVSHEFPPIGGGGANACFFLTKEYVKIGHTVTVITANYEKMPEQELINGVKVIRISSKRTHRDYCDFGEMVSYLMKAIVVADRLAKKNNFDICQVFFGIPNGPIGYWLKKKYKIPYVIRFGGGDIPGAQKRFEKIYKFINPFVKILWNNADALVANSNELKRAAEDFYSKKKICVIHNGVDVETYCIADKFTEEIEIKILFVSRLIKGKGLQHIIPMLDGIQEQVKSQVRLIVVGEGPFRTELEKLTGQHVIKAIVQFEGGKDKQELRRYYQNADIFILPSDSEGMPNVVLEAMASGLPIVMTPCGGSEELIHGNGYITTIDYFKDAIIKLCKNRQLRITMGKTGHMLVKKKFLWEQTAEKYLKIFDKICTAYK